LPAENHSLERHKKCNCDPDNRQLDGGSPDRNFPSLSNQIEFIHSSIHPSIYVTFIHRPQNEFTRVKMNLTNSVQYTIHYLKIITLTSGVP